MAYIGSQFQAPYRTPLDGCARGFGTGGGAGLYLWAQRMGFPVRLLEDPLRDISTALPGGPGHCVVTMGNGPWSPLAEGLDSSDWLSVRDWIAGGNTLVVVTSRPEDLPLSVRREFSPSARIEKESPLPSASSLFGSSVPDKPPTSEAPVKGGGVLTVQSDGPRWGGEDPASMPQPPASDLARWQLAGDSKGGVLFRIPIDRGAIYVLLDDYAWTNGGLDKGENARVLATLLRRELRDGGVLALDEYRHGHGRSESFLVYLLTLPGSSAFLWLAFLWAVLYLYGRNVRLRPAEVYRDPERRTAQEHIDAVAQLYERARAAPLVVEASARRLRQLSRSSAEPSASVEDALRRADEYAESRDRPSSPRTATRIVNELLQLRKRIYGTRNLS